MAKPTLALVPKVEPERTAYCILKVSPGLWSTRKLLLRGESVLAYEDSDADTRSACIGRAIRMMERES
jgi:hypothetical protein